MLSFHYHDMGGKVIALQSAENYRYLRQCGIYGAKNDRHVNSHVLQ